MCCQIYKTSFLGAVAAASDAEVRETVIVMNASPTTSPAALYTIASILVICGGLVGMFDEVVETESDTDIDATNVPDVLTVDCCA